MFVDIHSKQLGGTLKIYSKNSSKNQVGALLIAVHHSVSQQLRITAKQTTTLESFGLPNYPHVCLFRYDDILVGCNEAGVGL